MSMEAYGLVGVDAAECDMIVDGCGTGGRDSRVGRGERRKGLRDLNEPRCGDETQCPRGLFGVARIRR